MMMPQTIMDAADC